MLMCYGIVGQFEVYKIAMRPREYETNDTQ